MARQGERVDTQFLESLLSVIRSGSIAAGARQQGISPAAMTLRIKTLEKEFGTALVHRSGRTVVPTDAGARLYESAQSVLRALDDLHHLARGDGMVGQLRIGVIASISSEILAPMLKYFDEKHPESRVFVQHGISSALYAAVARDELDAALIVEPEFGIPKSCTWQRLNVEPLVLITPRAMPVTHPHEVLEREPLIRNNRIYWGGGLADAYLHRIGIEPQEHYELDSLQSVANLVASGLGVALVPDWAGRWHSVLPIARHALPVPGFARHVGILSSKASVRARHVEALSLCARRALDELASPLPNQP